MYRVEIAAEVVLLVFHFAMLAVALLDPALAKRHRHNVVALDRILIFVMMGHVRAAPFLSAQLLHGFSGHRPCSAETGRVRLAVNPQRVQPLLRSLETRNSLELVDHGHHV